jgi:hypothetical protein
MDFPKPITADFADLCFSHCDPCIQLSRRVTEKQGETEQLQRNNRATGGRGIPFVI